MAASVAAVKKVLRREKSSRRMVLRREKSSRRMRIRAVRTCKRSETEDLSRFKKKRRSRGTTS